MEEMKIDPPGIDKMTLVGELSLTIGDIKPDADEGELAVEHYEFVTDKEIYPIHFESPDMADRTPLNRRIALTVTREPVNGFYVVMNIKPWFSYVGPAPALSDGPKTITMGVYFCLSPDDIDQLEEVQERADRWAVIVRDFWQTVYRRNAVVEVRGYVLLTDKLPDRGVWLYAEQQALHENLAATGDDWEPYYRHVVGNVSGSYCGWGQVGGRFSMTFAQCTSRTACHETGHNLGMFHSKAYRNGTIHEYGDTTCVMGKSWMGLNAVQRDRVGLEREAEMLHITGSKQIVVAPCELDLNGMAEWETQINVIRLPDQNPIYISKRVQEDDLIYLHEQAGRSPILIDTLSVGETTAIDEKNLHTVRHLHTLNGSSLVEVSLFGEEPERKWLTTPDPVPVIPMGAEVNDQHNGMWYDPLTAGQGFAVRVSDRGVGLLWFTYEEESRTTSEQDVYKYPLWNYYAGGVTDKGELANGIPLFKSIEDGTEEEVGRAWLGFYNRSEGLLIYQLNNGMGRGVVELTKAFGDPSMPVDGFYYDPETPGLGLNLSRQSDVMAGILYFQDKNVKNVYGQPIPETAQRFYSFVGQYNWSSGEALVGVYQPYGSSFRALGHYHERQAGDCLIRPSGDFKTLQVDFNFTNELGRDIRITKFLKRLM